MRDIIQLLVLVSLAARAAPGVQFQRRNDSQSLKCTLAEFSARAQCAAEHSHLLCRGGFSAHWIKGVRRDIEYLQVLDWPGECFNVAALQHHFPALKALELRNCTILKVFKGKFTATSKIEKISMHGLLSLWEVPPGLVSEMQELREMDLRENMLRHMRGPLVTTPPKLQRAYFSACLMLNYVADYDGARLPKRNIHSRLEDAQLVTVRKYSLSNRWDCSDGGLDWLAMETENGTARRRIADYQQLECHQQLYRGKPLHIVMDIIRNMRATCPEPCSCVMTHVVSDPAGAVIPLITVDCAGRRLHAPPAAIPASTTTLRLDNNKVTRYEDLLNATTHSSK